MKHILFIITAFCLFLLACPQNGSAQNNVNFDSLYVLVGEAEASGNTLKAIEIRKHIAEIYKEKYGENHPKYANELANIGLTYQMIQDYQNAISYWEKGDSIYHLLNDTLHFMQARYFLGTIYKEVQNFPKAISYYKQYVQLYKAIYRDLDVHLFEMDTLIGNLYIKLEDKYNTVLYWENACEIRKQLHGYRHKTYIKEIKAFINAYDNLAETEYFKNRNYIVAIECMKHSADICKRIYGEKSMPYAVRLSDIGHIYSTIGNSSKSIDYYQQSLNIAKRHRSDKINYSTILDNIGIEYGTIGDYQKAIHHLESSLKAAQKIHNQSRNEHILLVLNNLSVVYAKMGDYDKAQDYMKECLALIEHIEGKQSALYSFMQGNLGEIYFRKGDYQAAIPILSKTMGISRAAVGEEDIGYASSVLNLGQVYYCNQQFSKATNYISYAANICMQDVIRTFSTMTEEDRKLYWDQISPVLSPAYASNYRYSTDSTLSTLYNLTLFSKGLLLSSSIEFSKTIAESGNQKALRTYNELLSIRKMITSQKQIPITERTYDIEKAEFKAEQLERELVSLSKEFGDFTQNLKLGWRDVQAALSDRNVAVEFVEFPLDLTNSGDSIMYAALVIRKGWKAPKMIPLFTEKQLSSFSYKIQTNQSNTINRFYNNPAIYNIVWGHLENENIIQEGDTIYFSASGLLHKLGIEYLPHRVDKNFTIRRLSSTKQLCMDSPKSSYNNAVLYGGLKYDTDDQAKIAESNKAFANGYNASGMDSRLMANITRGSHNDSWGELEGTKLELDNICKLYANHGLLYEVYSGTSGVEETFKMLSGRNTPIIFIATHGFFIPESQVKESKFMKKMMDFNGDNNTSAKPDLTMQRSGLVMSGGNAAWNGEPIPEGVEDGILTAQEVSELNLQGTELVVLSACETGLGEVSGEGVFGLQRGFKKAGAQTIIMSLWKVHDLATHLMMSTFFQHLLNGETKYDAFRAAQETVKEQYPTPYYWASFIMLD